VSGSGNAHGNTAPTFQRVALLLLGTSCCATAVIFIKLSTEHALLLSAYRTLGAAAVLFPLFLRGCRSGTAGVL
jgi:hypothetical protein